MPCLPGKLRSWDDRIERIVAGNTRCQIKPVSAAGSEFLMKKGKKRLPVESYPCVIAIHFLEYSFKAIRRVWKG